MSKQTNARFKQELMESIHHGFIDKNQYNTDLYAPKILLNDSETGQHILTDIQESLSQCNFFAFNVAFITQAGIAMLKTQFSDLADKNVMGRMIISPYLSFNDPLAMRELLKLKNVEVRIADKDSNMHAKFYYFDHGDEQVVITGSSNLTHTALKVNYEWNVKLSSHYEGDYIQQTLDEFDRLWFKSEPLTEEVIQNYSKTYKPFTLSDYNQLKESNEVFIKNIQPNKMQKEALVKLQNIRKNKHAKKALVISATGTGKTYLSAFDVRQYNPKTFLFIVHREQILRKAMKDYQKVLGFRDEEAVIYKSGMNIKDKRYVFATVQSLSKEENINSIPSNQFEYILIDEVHKAGAKSYQFIINHFTPSFLLGMTATPERTDGINIYELFDYNVAYEIRLQDALDAELLCPFIYFGVSELSIDGQLVTDKSTFNQLVSEQRVDHLIEKVEYYGYSGDKLRGLIFCSTKKEANELSNKMNHRGYKTVALSGEDSQDTREKEIDRLEEGELDYILTVDIFNEGIDIPSINQVVMLRNTQSSIVFVQQLGRGLRLHDSKEYVTVIDFIGNYQNNYLIPIALFGDQSMDKDNYRSNLINRNQLSGITTINFEEVAQKQIFQSIQSTNLSRMVTLRNAYLDVKHRIGRIPKLYDFIIQDSIDPEIFFLNNAFNYFGDVILKFDDDINSLNLTSYAQAILSFATKELMNGKRPHELMLLHLLIENSGSISKDLFKQHLKNNQITTEQKIIDSAINVLTFNFFNATDRKKYGSHLVIENEKHYQFIDSAKNLLKNQQFKILLKDIIKVGLSKCKKYPAGFSFKKLTVGEKYSRKDVCRLLLWDKDETSTMFGYKVKHGTCPIFVTYHKSDDISESTQYQDAFVNQQLFHWYTRSKRTLKSKEVDQIVRSHELNIDLHLFVKKEDSEGTDFYYLGQVTPQQNSIKETTMSHVGSNDPVVTMNLKLENSVPYQLYHYLTSNDA